MAKERENAPQMQCNKKERKKKKNLQCQREREWEIQ